MEKLKQLLSELTIARSTKHSSTAKERYIEHIPVDILIDIFLRLPSKSIARFRCVSKSWASILSRPYFTELFLTKSFNHPRLLFTVQLHGKLLFFSAPQNPHANSSLVVTRYKTHSTRHHIFSSLHGLVCCQDTRRCEDTKPPVICNPSTGEFLTLPEVESITRIYCGYDPTEKKYKLFCLSAFFNTNRAWVLTLETGKLLWRMIECKLHGAILTRGHMICIDGVLYYLAHINELFVIVSFDVKSEKFSFINIDDKSMTLASTLINYEGRLGVAQFTDNNQTILRLWFLEDALMNTWSNNIYQLPLSWKHPCDNRFQIVGMTRTCDIVLSPCNYSDPFYIYYYNVEGNTLARVEIQGLQELKSHCPKIYTFQDYVEDLTLMKSL